MTWVSVHGISDPNGRYDTVSRRVVVHGKAHYLWRAVDQDGNVLDILVTSRCDTKAATRFFRKLLAGLRSDPDATDCAPIPTVEK